MELSILVVSYETRELTLACLRSVRAETRTTQYELIAVDNASSDDSAAAIRAQAPWAELIASEENLGFAAANNLAAERARGEYLLLLNPDTVVLDGAIDALVRFARERPEAGIWGGRTVFEDGRPNATWCWGRPTVWSTFCRASGLSAVLARSPLFNPEAIARWSRRRVQPAPIVSGCFLLIRRELWERLGGFDPAFFMYGEEADLCLRAAALGARPLCSADARIVHHGGASERSRADKQVRLYDAKARLILRHLGPLRGPLAVAWLTSGVLLRSLAYRLLGRLRRERFRPSAECWTAVWRRRADWKPRRRAA